MKLNALLMSTEDIQLKTVIDRSTGEQRQRGIVRLLVTNPTNLLDVTISPDQVSAGVHQELAKRIGKQSDFLVDYRDLSFANDEGKYVAIKGFIFVGFPQ